MTLKNSASTSAPQTVQTTALDKNSRHHGRNAVHFKGISTWNNLPGVIKSSKFLCEFKRKIKNGNIDCE